MSRLQILKEITEAEFVCPKLVTLYTKLYGKRGNQIYSELFARLRLGQMGDASDFDVSFVEKTQLTGHCAVFYPPSSPRLIIDLNISYPFQPKNSPFTA